MKSIKYYTLILAMIGISLTSCFNLDEEVFDRVDATIYNQDEASVKRAVASIY